MGNDSDQFIVYNGEVYERRSIHKIEVEPLPESFGKNLDSIEKAYEWCVNPHNWFDSTLDVVRWDGIVPTVASWRGRELARMPYDKSFPEVIVWLQRQKKSKSKQEDGE